MSYRTTIPFPDPSKVGLFIGKQGKNIKELSERANCKISINKQKNVEIIAYSKSSLETAISLVTKSINTITAGFSHPEEAYNVYIFFKSPSQFDILLKPYGGETPASHANKQLFMPVISLSKDDDLSNLLAATSLQEKPVQLHANGFTCTADTQTVMNKIATQLYKTATVEKQQARLKDAIFTNPKLIFYVSLGKCLYYPARTKHDCFTKAISAQKLESMKIGLEHDLKSTFVPTLSETVANKIITNATNKGFAKTSEFTSAVIHCVHSESNAKYAVRVQVNDAKLTVKNISKEGLKPFFAQVSDFANEGPSVDIRLRMDVTCAVNSASAITNDPDIQKFVASLSWDIKQQECTFTKGHLSVDTIRYKRVTVFKKEDYKLTMEKIKEAGKKDEHVEVFIKDKKMKTACAGEKIDEQFVNHAISLMNISFELYK